MVWVKPLTEITKHDAALAGGKGASLGEMISAGIPVPPGYVVVADAFEQFFEKNNLREELDTILYSVKHDQMHTVEHASEKIRPLILNAKIPSEVAEEITAQFDALNTPYAAIRSSATAEDSAAAAWAGQLETFLNIPREHLLEKVRECWASLFTPRAIFYRFEKGMHGQAISVAVVIQKMVESEYSGVAFSVHPVTEDRNQLIIEAAYGLGEAVVSGQVTPDSYIVEKQPQRIIKKDIAIKTHALRRGENGGVEWYNIPKSQASSRVLTDGQVHELSDLIVNIESHYGFPCDIEWAFENGRFFITQSRPITTLGIDKKSLRIRFDKEYSRECHLSTVQVWFAGEDLKFFELLEMPNRPSTYIFFDCADGIAHCYYGSNQMVIWDHICARYTADPSRFDSIEEIFNENLALLQPYFDGKVAILNRGDVASFTKASEPLWSTLAICYWITYFDTGDMFPARILERSQKIRSATEHLIADADRVYQEGIKIIAGESYLPEYAHLSLEEVDTWTPPSREVLQARARHYIYDGTLRTDSLEAYGTSLGIEISRPQTLESVFGSSVYPGKVQGRACICLKVSDSSKVQDGDILIASMTMPEYGAALGKAAAFVTDEGGLMCHAAIVAREMKKPCVTGTYCATNSFKDGDMVEVDANAGTIRLL